MTDSKQYDLSTPEGFIQAFGKFNYLKDKAALIEIREVKKTRSNLQNRALHLWFTHCADALNEAGDYIKFTDFRNVEVDVPWEGEKFKDYWIRPIIKVLYDYKSTTELKTNEIDQLIDVITKRFGDKGISVRFPSKFDLWVKELEKKGIY